MTLKSTLEQDMKDAMKAGDQLTRDVLRMLRARILEAEVEKRASAGRQAELDDSEVRDVLAKYAKQRRQSIDMYQQAGRSDLVEQETKELGVVQRYLPQGLSRAELESIVSETIRESGAAGPKDMGLVMRLVMAKVKDRADGKAVNEVVRGILQN